MSSATVSLWEKYAVIHDPGAEVELICLACGPAIAESMIHPVPRGTTLSQLLQYASMHEMAKHI